MMRRMLSCGRSGYSSRSMTTRGQFNPIHSFSASLKHNEAATTPEEFRQLIANPGPLRIGYSADYVDWYHRAYREKVLYKEKKQRAAAKVEGPNSAPAVGAPELGIFAGMVRRPQSSSVRLQGEQEQSEGQKMIEEATVEHGMLDCFERQPQFPVIHIDRCSDMHVRELVEELIIDEALCVDAVWEKALLYRSLLAERRSLYPKSFEYIHKFVDDVVFARVVEDPQNPSEKQILDADKFPQREASQYFSQCVQRYHIENALDAHVFLSCHRLPDAEKLLFTDPAPKELKEALVSAPPLPFPSLDALMNDDGNLALLRVLLFAELNTFVSTDPFLKFPNAAASVQKPKFEHIHAAGLSQGSASTMIERSRGKRFGSLPQSVNSALDARGNDISRLQRSHAQSDLQFAQKELPKAAEADPAGYALAGNTYLNPRTVRAEVRDHVTRKVLRGMRLYEVGREKCFRMSIDEVRAKLVVHAGAENCVPVTAPTIPRFLSMILSDPVVTFLLATCGRAVTDEIQSTSRMLARQYFNFALEYFTEALRRVNHQKCLVTAALLDDQVSTALRTMKETATGSLADQLRRLPTYVPFSQRTPNELGFPSEARLDDYARWMRPPQK